MNTPIDLTGDVSNDAETMDDLPVAPSSPLSRRGFGRHLLGASAVAVLVAMGKRDTVQAAPLTDTWKLGGNSGVNTDGTNFLGTLNVAPLVFKTAATAGSALERMRITPTGNVGIGTTVPSAKLQVHSTTYAVFGRHSAASGTQPGVYGDTVATVAGASGVQGVVRSTSPGVDSAGVLGVNSGTNNNGAGVRGSHAGGGHGVHGTSTSGIGVYGSGSGGAAVYGVTTNPNGSGVQGDANAANAAGVYGLNTYGPGVWGRGTFGGRGVFGESSENIGVYGTGGGMAGVYGESTAPSGYPGAGVWGRGLNGTYGVHGDSSGGIGVYGNSNGPAGVYGTTYDPAGTGSGVVGKVHTGGAGVFGENTKGGSGVWGRSTQEYTGEGVYGAGHIGVHGVTNGMQSSQAVRGDNGGSNTVGYAGVFNGRVGVFGNLSKGGGSFKIDHPLDPAKKYLSHSFVESPDMMNVYNGNTVLDQKGEATIKMPAYFEALNRDFRYQLTALDAPGPNLYIAERLKGNRFKIAGGTAGMEVSWQVTGIRQDAFANANRIQVEEDKPVEEHGKYLYPKEHGKPESAGVDARRIRKRDEKNPQPVVPPGQ